MTSIQWTDEVWNPVTGCSRVSEGCRNCYIERTPPFRMAGRKLGDPVQLHHDRLDDPLRWRKPRRVFVNSLSDLFHEDVPDDFVDRVFAVIALTSEHTYQILTKRPDRMRKYFTDHADGGRHVWQACQKIILANKRSTSWPLPNVHLGVSVEDQKTADERIPILLQTPAAVRWVSYESALGPVDFRQWLKIVPRMRTTVSADSGLPCGPTSVDWIQSYNIRTGEIVKPQLDWLVVGGESGPKARPCNLVWIRSAVRQCQAAKVPVFVKQLGGNVIDRNDAGFDGEMPTDWPMDTDVDDPENEWNWQGAKIHIRLKDKKGGDPAEWPEDLRVREFPR